MRIIQALVNLGVLCIPGAIAGVVSARLSRTSKEEWTLLAWAPPLPLFGLTIYLAVVTTRDPTAANLWPFAMAGFAALTAILFGVFLLARRFLQSEESTTARWRRREHRK